MLLSSRNQSPTLNLYDIQLIPPYMSLWDILSFFMLLLCHLLADREMHVGVPLLDSHIPVTALC